MARRTEGTKGRSVIKMNTLWARGDASECDWSPLDTNAKL